MTPGVVIAGPTGSGKSHLALGVAERFSGEIVNCDSIQLYRYFDAGSAKTPLAERRGIPHHLIDLLEPDDVFTAGDYARAAREAIRGIGARGKLPVVAGGTGFYLRAMLEGLFEGPGRDDALRKRLLAREARRPGQLHKLLMRLDPEAAKRIHPNDIPKLTRALEVRLLTKKSLTQALEAGRSQFEGFRWLKLALNPPRKDLYRHLDERARSMFEQGLVEETRGILDMHFPRTAKPFESLGYAQALRVIDGEWSVDQAIADTQLRTRQYAKRQMTWFRREPGIRWIDGFGDDPDVLERVFELTRVFLSAPLLD